jgi:hypothetical protein
LSVSWSAPEKSPPAAQELGGQDPGSQVGEFAGVAAQPPQEATVGEGTDSLTEPRSKGV